MARLQRTANSLRDSKLRGKSGAYVSVFKLNPVQWLCMAPVELVVYGVGYHHAGMDVTDRKAIEAMFAAGEVPVLCMYYISTNVMCSH